MVKQPPERLIICKPPNSLNKRDRSNQLLLLQGRSSICGILNFAHTRKWSSLTYTEIKILICFVLNFHGRRFCRGSIRLLEHGAMLCQPSQPTPLSSRDGNTTGEGLRAVGSWLSEQGLVTAKERVALFRETRLLLTRFWICCSSKRNCCDFPTALHLQDGLRCENNTGQKQNSEKERKCSFQGAHPLCKTWEFSMTTYTSFTQLCSF